MNYNNKSVLLVAPVFGGFYESIKAALIKQGAKKVFFIENRHFFLNITSTHGSFKLLRKIYYFIMQPAKRYSSQIIKSQSLNEKYDICICIQDHCLHSSFFEYLRKVNPKITIILYLWDPIEMYNCLHNRKFFDKIVSFDIADCEKYDIKYLPNFFIFEKFDNPKKKNIQTDLFFVGSQYGDRYTILSSVFNNLKNKVNLDFKLLIRDKQKFHSFILYKMFNFFKLSMKYQLTYELLEKKKKDSFLIYENISRDVVFQKLIDSKCILDIQYEYQAGISQQSMLAIALGKKIITTNQHFKDTIFYSDQIFIIDRNKPMIPIDFINNEIQVNINPNIWDYEINNWVIKLLND